MRGCPQRRDAHGMTHTGIACAQGGHADTGLWPGGEHANTETACEPSHAQEPLAHRCSGAWQGRKGTVGMPMQGLSFTVPQLFPTWPLPACEACSRTVLLRGGKVSFVVDLTSGGGCHPSSPQALDGVWLCAGCCLASTQGAAHLGVVVECSGSPAIHA